MRYSIKLLAMLLLSSVTSYAQTTIEFDVTGLTDGYEVHIFKMEGQGGSTVYHQAVTDGRFNYTFNCGTLMENSPYFSVMVMDRQTNNSSMDMNVYLNQGDKIHVKGSGANAIEWTTDSKHPGQIFYDAVHRNAEQVRLHKEIDKLSAQARMPEADRNALSLAYDSLYEIIGKDHIKQMEVLPVDQYWLAYFAIMTREVSYNPNIKQEKLEALTKLYGRLSEDDLKTTDGKAATANIFNKPIRVGDQMKDYDLYDIDGNLRHLGEFKGKEFIVDFGSYFCGPCRLVGPYLDYLYKAGNRTFEIVSVNNDTKSQFEENARMDKVGYNVLHDRDGNGGIFSIYKVSGIPTFFVFGADGIVKDTWMGAYPEKIFDAVTKNDQFKWNTTVEQKDGAKVVSYPKFESTNSLFVVDKVTLYADSTVIDFISCDPTASFGSGSVLRTGGKDYKAVSSSIGFDKHMDGHLGKGLRITATFEPLPKGAQKFDYIEGDCEYCFKITGIEIPEK